MHIQPVQCRVFTHALRIMVMGCMGSSKSSSCALMEMMPHGASGNSPFSAWTIHGSHLISHTRLPHHAQRDAVTPTRLRVGSCRRRSARTCLDAMASRSWISCSREYRMTSSILAWGGSTTASACT